MEHQWSKNMDPSRQIMDLIERLKADEYSRGQADARRELLTLLSPAKAATSSAAPRKKRSTGGKRAPKGTVPAFVNRVLGETSGVTVQEIMASAKGANERMAKMVSVRNQLQKGEKEGRYVNKSGKWSLSGRK